LTGTSAKTKGKQLQREFSVKRTCIEILSSCKTIAVKILVFYFYWKVALRFMFLSICQLTICFRRGAHSETPQ